ncbi:MAG: PQQ-dependent sugar dehydrogenase [Burkholderiales bacterium]|nr:PQQ-dependent sugar dehydrogenase [Burkholderiales bacterium]
MMLKFSAAAVSAALALGVASPVHADDANLDKLSTLKSTGTSLDLPLIPQTGPQAEAIKETLKNIKLPAGFKIELYALVPDARNMAVGPSTGVVFVGTRKTRIYAVTDRDKDRVADEVKEFSPSLKFNVPNGVCFSKDGFLYVVEHNRVLVFPAAEFFYEGPDVAAGIVVPQGKLIPTTEESFNHGARVCKIGPDKKLYVSLGQPYNVPPKEKLKLYDETGIGGIVRFETDGTGREVFAKGSRNSGGMAFNRDGKLWWNDHQVDGMGDTIPPGETNISTAVGQHFGFPWFGGGKIRTNEYKDSAPPANAVFPVLEHDAHAADMGALFYTGKQFPEKFRGGYFWAQHGSWNRTDPAGARVMWVPVKDGAPAGKPEPFAEGWLTEDGEYLGRPVDVAVLNDGSLLVSDDFAGAIYRISYKK